MKLLDSLLDAIIRLEGDALVMHVGEKPYVVTASASMHPYRGPLAWGQVELSSRVLTFDAVLSMLAQILPVDQQRALEEIGAVEHEIPTPSGMSERFTVVAARGGEDVWVEVRREARQAAAAAAPATAPPPPASAPAEPVATTPVATTPDVPSAEPVAHAAAVPMPEEVTEVEEPVAAPAPGSAIAAPPDVAEPEEEEHVVAESHPDPLDSIVVALPGDEVEEVRLSAVAEHAIQLVDDEPQGVPTEAEVDAMLAATASALLTSGLSSGLDGIEDLTIDPHPHDNGGELDLPLTSSAVHMLNVGPETSEPAFELSPPTAVALLEEPEPKSEADEIHYVAVGTPLFSEEAMLAAAAPVALEAVAEPEIHAEAAVAGAPPDRPFDEIHARAPHDTIDSPTAPPSDAASSDAAEPFATTPLNAGPEAAAPELAPRERAEPTPEMPMDATPEPRRDAAAAEISQPASSSVETPEPAYAAAPSAFRGQDRDEEDGRPSVVVPLGRSAAKSDLAVPFTPSEDAALMQTLRTAAARGASTVYVVAQSKPMIRVDGEISPLETEPTLTAADVDRLVLELAPPRRREALQSGPVEWLCDVPQIGRVRCLTFRDHRGPGVLFRMLPERAISADQLGLTQEVQALCQQSDGLVLVTGARASGKSTLLNAFVDLINRTRSDHLVTIETQIGFVHESRRSFISQRETRGDVELAASFARAALREDPDVMVIEDLKSAEMVAAALEAAESGRLVLASTPAASTIGALERLIDIFPAERRPKARMSLATSLRGVLAQVLLRKIKGGQVAAREILLNTPGVSTLVLEGKMFQLPAALEGGRRLGMVPLTDSLVSHVREGTVQVDEAYRKALDRSALLAHLKREGMDTSFADRLA